MKFFSNSSSEFAYSNLNDYQKWYAYYHGYASVIVCVLGVICNLFNIVVLTCPNMRRTTNYILTCLAVSDLLTMLSYIPFALHFYCVHGQDPTPERNTRQWIYFFLFHVNFSVTTHTVSIWLGVILAIFRYIYVTRSGSTDSHLARIATLCITIVSIVILIPNYISLHIVQVQDTGTNQTVYDLVAVDNNLTNMLNFWIHALLIKLLPCFLMLVFGGLLVCTMRSSNRRRRKFRRRSMTSEMRQQNVERSHTRTTNMLVSVIILFLVTELPQGILALCCGLLPGFFDGVYAPLGDTMDIIALINNGINFTLYCSMSKQFRQTFLCLFAPWVLSPEKRQQLKLLIMGSHVVSIKKISL